jgi:hypothetical protein
MAAPLKIADRFSEASLSRYYESFGESGSSLPAFLASHPVATLIACVAALRLPRHKAEVIPSVEGRAIFDAVTRPLAGFVPVGRLGVSLLHVPEDPLLYSAGREKQTLRRKVRHARGHGISFRVITDPSERDKLLDLAHRTELAHPDPKYRSQHPRLADLTRYDLWLAGFTETAQPVALSVTPTEGQWALLRYFRTLGHGPTFSDSRYLMTQVLVAELAKRDVRYLVDARQPMGLPNGLRHFQRMVGFRMAWVAASLISADPQPAGRLAARRMPGRRMPGRRSPCRQAQ